MANPKYAGLPGIAFDQPDVYETNDLPESDQSHSISEAIMDQSDSVEAIQLSASEAFDKFKGRKALDSRNVDFTDSIANKRKTGYGVTVGEFEMLDGTSKEDETPLQSYNRLQFEVKELLEQVQHIKSSNDSKDEMTPAALTEQIGVIQKDLQNLHLEQVLGSETIQDMSDPLKSAHSKLLLQLDNYKKSVSTEKKVAPSATAASDTLTYELYVKPEQSRLEELAKISELEQRLKNLEGLVGQDRSKLNFLTANTDEKSIVAGIRLLSAKLNLLDPVYLPEIENRLMVLNQCMQQVAEKKQQIDDAEKQNKVAELYELAKKVEGMSVSLPQVVDRLVALKSLHEQALQFSKALTQLDGVQQQITNSVHSNQALLKKLQETFSQNTEMVEKNISSLNTRMEAIAKFEK